MVLLHRNTKKKIEKIKSVLEQKGKQMGKNRKNETLFQSIRCAWNGLRRAFATEKNLKIYCWILAVTMVVNLLLGLSVKDYIPYGICVFGVFSAECLNTAAERICDFLTEKYEEMIRDAKDIAAAAVLLWGVAFWITEFILIGAKLFG